MIGSIARRLALLRRSQLETIGLALGIVLLVVSTLPRVDSGADGQLRYWDTDRIARGLLPNARYSSLQPLLALPLYWLGTFFTTPAQTVAYFNLIAFLLLLAVIWRSFSADIARATILLLLSASMFPANLQGFFGEPLAALLVVLGFVLLERHIWWAALAFAAGVGVVPATIPAFALVAAYLAWTKKRWWLLLLVAGPAAVHLTDNFVKYHSFVSSYFYDKGDVTIMPYSGIPGFSYPLVLGLLSVLFSYGKGLIFFIPGLLLAFSPAVARVPAEYRTTLRALLLFALGTILVYSRWWAWYGGTVWGPRFFLTACVPACLMLAFALRYEGRRSAYEAAALTAILALATWGCIEGFVYGVYDSHLCYDNHFNLEMLCWYAPEWSPLWRWIVVGFGKAQPLRLAYAGWATLCFAYFAIGLLLSATPYRLAIALDVRLKKEFPASDAPLAAQPSEPSGA